MNAEVQSQLDRVEAALTTLLDSITSYNPSPVAAVTLITADDALSESLTHLAAHQANHTRLLALRATTTALDDQLKGTLSLLAQTRAELLSLPLTPPTITQVDYRTLLNFAQRISRFTIPPTHQPPLPPSLPLKDESATPYNTRTSVPPEIQSLAPLSLNVAADTPNGALFPPTTPVLPSANLPAAATDATAGAAATAETAPGLDPAVQAWLSPPSHARPFVPWPSEDRIRGGTLGTLQGMVISNDAGGFMDADSAVKVEGQQIMDGLDAKPDGAVASPVVKTRQSRVVPKSEPLDGPQARVDVFDDLDLYNPEDES